MGASSWAPPHLCRLLFLAGVFLLVFLYLTSPRRLPHSACTWRGQPCPSDGEMPADQETVRTTTPPRSAALQPTPPDPQVLTQDGKGFQIQRLRSTFAASLAPDGQILLGEYLQGWTEMMKLLEGLGAAFRLVSSEAAGKVGELQKLRRGPHGHHYRTLQGMVAFEAGPGAGLEAEAWPGPRPEAGSRPVAGPGPEGGGGAGPEAGSRPVAGPGPEARPGPGRRGLRTLLRLHRALRWLQLFLGGLARDGEAAPARLCAEAYSQALAPFHAWWVRQAVGLAFLAMPARPELLRLTCAGAGPDAQRVLGATARTLENVYNATQHVYAAHGLLGLP